MFLDPQNQKENMIFGRFLEEPYRVVAIGSLVMVKNRVCNGGT